MSEQPVVVARAKNASEAAELLYGLSLRGVRATPRSASGRDPIEILVPPDQAFLSRACLPVIWDAVLGFERALTPEGACPFCEYDQRGVPADQPCPECGVLLSSPNARRAYRDGRNPSPDPD